VGDALELSGSEMQFDSVLDCGLFHVFGDDDRARFVASLGGVVVPGGRYFMLCFSDKEPGDWGPRRVKEEELRQSFAHGWQVDSIEDSVIEVTIRPEGSQAWLALFTRM
jgi:cyclopropane fatty-acyl-phospholipid synthase-like methyltransferase